MIKTQIFSDNNRSLDFAKYNKLGQYCHLAICIIAFKSKAIDLNTEIKREKTERRKLDMDPLNTEIRKHEQLLTPSTT